MPGNPFTGSAVSGIVKGMARPPAPQPVRSPTPPARPVAMAAPTGPVNFISVETRGDGPKVREHAIDFSRNVQVWRPTSAEQLSGHLRAIGLWREGQGVNMGSHTCSWSMQRTLKKAGTPGWSGDGAGNANQLGGHLKRNGYAPVTDGQVRPGDVVIYMDGGGGHGHVGIATGAGRGRPVQSPNVSRTSQRTAQPSMERMRLGKTMLESPSFDPFADPFEDIVANAPAAPGLSQQEIMAIRSTLGGIPEVDYLLGFLAED